ncbi:MAG TPA: HlyC/CorC family transporter [Deltaproteobacteria bacterium]|nr:HlyC/CorC family transporter [Deltaproteobacteria bacterium]
MNPLLGLPLVGVTLLLQGFFSGSEMAFVSANRALLQAKADGGSAGAELALQMLRQEEDRLLGTCLIGTNLCLIGGTTTFGLVMVQQGLPQEWLQTLLYVPLGLLFGEAVPKLVYRHYADALTPRLAPLLRGVQRPLAPALWIVRRWRNLLQALLRPPEDHKIRREDIVQMLDDEAGPIDPEDRALIQRLLAMNETTVEACMTPLIHVHAIAEDAPLTEGIQIVLQEGYSRIPVFRDRVDNIVGRIEHRDLLFSPPETTSIAGLIRPVRFVPESKRIDELLREMREHADAFVVVVDEYGGSVGIVTLEDLLEEVIGDIEDERDLRTPSIRRLGEREWRVPARTEIDELEEVLGHALPKGEYETIAGLLLAVTGRIPEAGEVVRIGGLIVHIEAASDRAVHLVRVVLPAKPER